MKTINVILGQGTRYVQYGFVIRIENHDDIYLSPHKKSQKPGCSVSHNHKLYACTYRLVITIMTVHKRVYDHA